MYMVLSKEFESNQVTKFWWKNKHWNLESNYCIPNCDWSIL